MGTKQDAGKAVSEAFISLAFDIEAHEPGYIDSCYVADSLCPPPGAARRPLLAIAHDCAILRERVATSSELEPERVAYLRDQLAAIAGRLEIMQRPRRSMLAEARALFDIEPEWIAEQDFLDDRALLDDQLPGSGDIHQRLDDFRSRARVPLDQGCDLFQAIVSRLRGLSQRDFGLPEDQLSITFYDDRPSLGYHRYLGAFRSSIEINSAKVLDVPGVIHLLAHEAYPGHHTELVLKEVHLTRGRGWLEHSLTLLDVPSCVISEAIATRALSMLMGEDELVHWCSELLPAVGVDAAEAGPRVIIENASQRLRAVATNAALMLDAGRSDDEVASYVREFGVTNEWEARRLIRFIRSVRAYVFVYNCGGRLFDDLLAGSTDPKADFLQLLREPITPGWIRARSGD